MDHVYFTVRKKRNVGKDKTKRRIQKQKQSRDKKKFKRTLKDKYEEEIVDLPNIHKVEDKLYHVAELNGSYSPEINKRIQHYIIGKISDSIFEINFEDYYSNGEPLMLYNPEEEDSIDRYKPYDSIESRMFLLDRLDLKFYVDKMITPKQNDSNCWFNCMFMVLFVSDKGRKFFKFFRHLMIEGRDSLGIEIPTDLKIAFAYLNYAIDACLTGNSVMYNLDTNNIIKRIYENLHFTDNDWITNVGDAGNPIYYYMDIMDYLKNNSIQFFTLFNDSNCLWKDRLSEKIIEFDILPEVIVIEFIDDINCSNKPITFKINNIKYALDSICIRDVDKYHVCSLLTCNSKEYFYDGASHTTLIPFEWKNKINKDFSWVSTDLKYNFLKSYQQCIYYRVTK